MSRIPPGIVECIMLDERAVLTDQGATTTARPGTTGGIFLSPHYDDVVLSCGGTVALLADQGYRPIAVTIFGGEVIDDAITDFARWKHSRWGASGVEQIITQRQTEDYDAAAVLRCDIRWLGFPDAIYRGDRYLSDPSLFGTPQTLEAGLVDVIADEIRRLPEWNDDVTLYVPLGVGAHVDHQIVFAAGRRFAREGVRVLAYEDCPYAIHTPAGVDRRLAEIAGQVGAPLLVPIETTLDRRIGAIGEYRTQVPVIFRFTNDVHGTMTAFAHRTGGTRGPAERFWPVLPSASPEGDA